MLTLLALLEDMYPKYCPNLDVPSACSATFSHPLLFVGTIDILIQSIFLPALMALQGIMAYKAKCWISIKV